MKYCSDCKNVYPNDQICECVKNPKYSWGKPATMKDVEPGIEVVCECGSTSNLTYHERYRFMDGSLSSIPSRYVCAECTEKARIAHEREEAMKFLIINNQDNENEFCEDKAAAEKYLEEYARDLDYDCTLDDLVILKLELITGEITAEDFLDPKKTHLVFWEYESYRVEDVISPTIEWDGERTVNW